MRIGKVPSMPTNFDYILPSPVGNLGLDLTDRGILFLSYTSSKRKLKVPRSGLAAEVYQQLLEYFNLHRTQFDLPLDGQGTKFQKAVWRELSKISFGRSLTYSDVAKKLRSGPRAVGNACRNNPISIIVPCHRVVSKSGIGGYSGKVIGNPIKRKNWLLHHEGVVVS